MRKRLGLLLLALIGSGTASVSEGAMIARWTFNTATAADLAGTGPSDVGGYALTNYSVGSSPGTLQAINGSTGSIDIYRGTQLAALGINSTALPGLKNAVTIWARVSLDTNLNDFASFFGLMQNTNAGGGDFSLDQALAAFKRSTNGDGTQNIGIRLESSTTAGGPGSGYPSVTTGQFFDLALVASPGVTTTGATLYVNGTPLAASVSGVPLGDFHRLALARLITSTSLAGSGNVGVTFDEVRVYDSVLTATQIGEITPVPVPEPATLGVLAAGLSLVLRRRR